MTETPDPELLSVLLQTPRSVLAQDGLHIRLPCLFCSEVVYMDPVRFTARCWSCGYSRTTLGAILRDYSLEIRGKQVLYSYARAYSKKVPKIMKPSPRAIFLLGLRLAKMNEIGKKFFSKRGKLRGNDLHGIYVITKGNRETRGWFAFCVVEAIGAVNPASTDVRGFGITDEEVYFHARVRYNMGQIVLVDTLQDALCLRRVHWPAIALFGRLPSRNLIRFLHKEHYSDFILWCHGRSEESLLELSAILKHNILRVDSEIPVEECTQGEIYGALHQAEPFPQVERKKYFQWEKKFGET